MRWDFDIAFINSVRGTCTYCIARWVATFHSHTGCYRVTNDLFAYTHKYIYGFNIRHFFLPPPICSYLPAPPSAKPPSCTAAFTGGISIANKPPTPPAQSHGQHNTSNWSHVQPARPVHSGYVHPQYNQQSMYSPSSYSSESANVVNQNQFQPQQVRLM